MTLAIFVVGIFVFVVTVYGAVVAGGLLLTGRQLDEQPELAPDPIPPDQSRDTAARARWIVNAKF